MTEFFRMRIWNALVLAGFLIVVPRGAGQASPAPDAQSIDNSLRLGTEAIRAGRVIEAEKYFQDAVKADPENPQALMELGVAELRLGEAGIRVGSPESSRGTQSRVAGCEPVSRNCVCADAPG